MFNIPITDKVTLLKNNGQKIEDIPAHVQSNMIFIQDSTIPIEEGDRIIRILPSKVEEAFIVIDRGFQSGFRGIKAHYQVKVSKDNRYNQKSGQTNINNFYGNVNQSQIQQDVKNSSQVITINEDYDKKDELKKYILLLKENINLLELESENHSVVTKNINTIEVELEKEVSKSKVINVCLKTIRSVLEGVTCNLIASGLIYKMSELM